MAVHPPVRGRSLLVEQGSGIPQRGQGDPLPKGRAAVTPEERAHAAIVEHLFREFGLGMETLARYQRMVAGSIRAAVEEEREACAALIDAREADVLARQYGREYPDPMADVDTQIRMAAVLLPELAAAIRSRS
jgi:hypothetical protein